MIWLPYKNFEQCVAVLTDEHCEDVLQEGLQLLRESIAGVEPTSRDQLMWHMRMGCLMYYVRLAEQELQCRGYDPDPGPIQAFSYWLKRGWDLSLNPPNWLGDGRFHVAQMSHLIRVNPEHYAQRLPLNTPLELPLVWPKGS